MSKSLEEQIFAEVSSFASQYPVIPDGAKMLSELETKFPQVPKGGVGKWLAKEVKAGRWQKARKANVSYYWPAK
jgi:hypothetical protein